MHSIQIAVFLNEFLIAHVRPMRFVARYPGPANRIDPGHGRQTEFFQYQNLTLKNCFKGDKQILTIPNKISVNSRCPWVAGCKTVYQKTDGLNKH